MGGADVRDAVQPHQHDVSQRVDVGDPHEQHHVEGAAREREELEAGQGLDVVADLLPVPLIHVDQHERGDRDADLLGVDRDGEPGDHAALAQAVEPGVGRGPGDVGHASRAR